MTLITPPLYQQQSDYPASYDRFGMQNMPVQPGVVNAGDFKVTPAGGALQVNVASGASFVQAAGTRMGYYQLWSGSADTLTVAAAHATLPRIDQIILRVKDAADLGDVTNTPSVEVLQGTATSGATLSNRTGAAALPNNCLRLADILVPAAYATTFVTNTHIRDKRPWAYGAFYRTVRNSNASATNDYTTTSTTSVSIDATNLAARIECTGVPVRMVLTGRITNTALGANVRFSPTIDGTMPDSDSTDWWYGWNTPVAGYQTYINLTALVAPSSGSHTFSWVWSTSSGTASLFARVNNPVVFAVEELIRANTTNSGA